MYMYTYLSVHGFKKYINTCTHLYVYINTHEIISIHELYVYACIYLLNSICKCSGNCGLSIFVPRIDAAFKMLSVFILNFQAFFNLSTFSTSFISL